MMNPKIFAFVTACLAGLTASTYDAIAHTPAENIERSTDRANIKEQRIYIKKPARIPRNSRRNTISQQEEQNTRINLNSTDLRQPHTLTISTNSGARLTGRVTVNGRVVKTLSGNRATINLSSCLSRGRHTIEITGNYRPTDADVRVEFSGNDTRVIQQTGGSGLLKQTLIVEVH